MKTVSRGFIHNDIKHQAIKRSQLTDISKMASTTFGTVLVARSKDQPATPLEQSLRTCSQRLRVVPRLSNHAHFIVKEDGSSLAVQLYDEIGIEAMERRWKEAEEAGRHGNGGARGNGGSNNRVPGEDWMLTKEAAAAVAGKSSNSGSNNHFNPLKDDATILGTQTFRDTFRNTAIFFVLGPPHSDLRRRQMARPTSFLNVVQRALASPRTGSAAAAGSNENGDTKNNNSNAGVNNATTTTNMGSSRIFLVTDVASLQSHLRTTIDSIRPDKLKMKEKFFAEQCRLNLVPPPPSKSPLYPSASAPASASSASSMVEVDNNVVAERVADALRAWSDGVGIPRGELDVVMGMLGSLEAVVTADNRALANVPVSDWTKQMIVAFFSSPSPAFGVDGGGEEQRDDDGMVEEELEQQVDQPNIAVTGGWTAGDRGESGMDFSGGVADCANRGDGAIPGMQSVGGFQPFSHSYMANNIGKAEGPRQFQVYDDYHHGNGGGGGGNINTIGEVGAGYGGPEYYNSNVWGGRQQPPSFRGANFGSRGWM